MNKKNLENLDIRMQRIIREYQNLKEQDEGAGFSEEELDSRYEKEFMIYLETSYAHQTLQKIKDKISPVEYRALDYSIQFILEAVSYDLEMILDASLYLDFLNSLSDEEDS
jgi:hypothetical protein